MLTIMVRRGASCVAPGWGAWRRVPRHQRPWEQWRQLQWRGLSRKGGAVKNRRAAAAALVNQKMTEQWIAEMNPVHTVGGSGSESGSGSGQAGSEQEYDDAAEFKAVFGYEKRPPTAPAVTKNADGVLDPKPMTCPGCGAGFQPVDPTKPGYLPQTYFNERVSRAHELGVLDDADLDYEALLARQTEAAEAEARAQHGSTGSTGSVAVTTASHRVSGSGSQSMPTPMSGEEMSALLAVLEQHEQDGDEYHSQNRAARIGKAQGGPPHRDAKAKAEFLEQALQQHQDAVNSAEDADNVLAESLSDVELLEREMARLTSEENAALANDGAMDVDASSLPTGYRELSFEEFSRGRYEDNGKRHDQQQKWEEDAEEEEAAGNAHGTNGQQSVRQIVCRRCHELRHQSKVDTTLRAGWSSDVTLTPKHFLRQLARIRARESVVLVLVDVFDFSPSFLHLVKNISGPNPVVVAVNKVDLLPSDVSRVRVRQWMHAQCRQGGLDNVLLDNIHIISSTRGMGMKGLLEKLETLSASRRHRVYVVGAANTGKSTFINRLVQGQLPRWLAKLHKSKTFEVVTDGGGSSNITANVHDIDDSDDDSSSSGIKEMHGLRDSTHAAALGLLNPAGTGVTASAFPGTTLNFVRARLSNFSLFDTPGIMLPQNLTSLLTGAELLKVVPTKRMRGATVRLTQGQTLLIGGFARVRLADGMPFFVTAFTAPGVSLHVTSREEADAFQREQCGDLLHPPESPERFDEFGPWRTRTVRITGAGWMEMACDIAISGLGWVGVTGVGNCRVQVSTPADVRVEARDPLLPYDVRTFMCKVTNGKVVPSAPTGKYPHKPVPGRKQGRGRARSRNRGDRRSDRGDRRGGHGKGTVRAGEHA